MVGLHTDFVKEVSCRMIRIEKNAITDTENPEEVYVELIEKRNVKDLNFDSVC